jgi:hypothetical protein
MTYFVVEHVYKGYPMFETISGVEDIDVNLFPNLETLWVCETKEEVDVVEKELRDKHSKLKGGYHGT